MLAEWRRVQFLEEKNYDSTNSKGNSFSEYLKVCGGIVCPINVLNKPNSVTKLEREMKMIPKMGLLNVIW